MMPLIPLFSCENDDIDTLRILEATDVVSLLDENLCKIEVPRGHLSGETDRFGMGLDLPSGT